MNFQTNILINPSCARAAQRKQIIKLNQTQTLVLEILNVGSAADRDSVNRIYLLSEAPTQRSVSQILTSEFDILKNNKSSI